MVAHKCTPLQNTVRHRQGAAAVAAVVWRAAAVVRRNGKRHSLAALRSTAASPMQCSSAAYRSTAAALRSTAATLRSTVAALRSTAATLRSTAVALTYCGRSALLWPLSELPRPLSASLWPFSALLRALLVGVGQCSAAECTYGSPYTVDYTFGSTLSI